MRKSNFRAWGVGQATSSAQGRRVRWIGSIRRRGLGHDVRELGYHGSYQLRIGTMWSIINPPGSSNRAHIHPGCIWSGVYYVQAPRNSGRIEFIDPRTQNLMSGVKYIPGAKRPRDCWKKVRYKPVAGRMLIFPAWLYHSVGPNRSRAKGKDADRIIVSFNLSQQRRR